MKAVKRTIRPLSLAQMRFCFAGPELPRNLFTLRRVNSAKAIGCGYHRAEESRLGFTNREHFLWMKIQYCRKGFSALDFVTMTTLY
jgi:hypothetical protein